jgi:SAM-dependent methyltransferase
MTEVSTQIHLETVPCNACGSTDGERFWEGRDRLHHTPGEFLSVRCRICGLVYMSPRPILEDMSNFYPDSYSQHQPKPQGARVKPFWNRVHHQMWKQSINQLYVLPSSGGTLLEIGCGSGSFLAEAQKAGWEVTGIEISRRATEHARAQNLNVYCGTPDTVELSGTFDLIRLSYVLEHVHDPLKTLQTVQSLLKPQGCAHVAIPNVGSIVARLFGTYWYDFDIPRHLYWYTPSSFRLLCEQADLNIVEAIGEVNTYVFWASVNYWLLDRGVQSRIANGVKKWGSKISLPLTFAIGWIPSKWLMTSRIHFIVAR